MEKKDNKKTLTKRVVVALIISAIITGICAVGWLDAPDQSLSDSFYQNTGMASENILVVGLDDAALEELGPMPWPRSYMADAIDYLNNADPDARPAVIGIDVLYTGTNPDDPEADTYLAEAAGAYDNVVVASAATFGTELVEEGQDFYINDRSISSWDAPYDELAQVTSTGQINAMIDTDGILRHGLLYIDNPAGERVYSFSRVIYEKFCEVMGKEKSPIPDTTDGFFYIPYYAQGGSYCDAIGFMDLVYGNVDPEIYKDKMVLIGPYATGMNDAYHTSMEHAALTYGVDIQANMIQAFENGFYPKEVARTPQLVFLFILCAAMIIFLTGRRMRDAVICEVAIVGLWIGLCFSMYRLGLIFRIFWVPLAASVIFVGIVAYNYLKAYVEKRRVESTFGHYVDPSVMSRLLEEGTDALELGGQTYDIAVLFVDIRGFTTMSESLEPQTVVEIINKYLTLTTECIMRHHGTLDKFVGDCTMAFWNAPFPQEDPVYLACAAAMDMVEGAKALGDELMEKYGRSVSFGVGVNWGPAVVGNIGAPKRMDYTAIGDTVNTAARLEANAPAGTVYISRAVADILGDRAQVTSLGATIKLKGKADGFEILTLDSLS